MEGYVYICVILRFPGKFKCSDAPRDWKRESHRERDETTIEEIASFVGWRGKKWGGDRGHCAVACERRSILLREIGEV